MAEEAKTHQQNVVRPMILAELFKNDKQYNGRENGPLRCDR
jgi:hypothetical protein